MFQIMINEGWQNKKVSQINIRIKNKEIEFLFNSTVNDAKAHSAWCKTSSFSAGAGNLCPSTNRDWRNSWKVKITKPFQFPVTCWSAIFIGQIFIQIWFTIIGWFSKRCWKCKMCLNAGIFSKFHYCKLAENPAFKHILVLKSTFSTSWITSLRHLSISSLC